MWRKRFSLVSLHSHEEGFLICAAVRGLHLNSSAFLFFAFSSVFFFFFFGRFCFFSTPSEWLNIHSLLKVGAFTSKDGRARSMVVVDVR